MRIAAALLATGVGIAAATSARAGILTRTPTFPVPDGTYLGTNGACVVVDNICSNPGTLTFVSITSAMFSPAGEDFAADVLIKLPITTLAGAPLGTLKLPGTLEGSVPGRTGPDETGNWTAQLDALDLSGSVMGHPLTVALDATDPTKGPLSITPVGTEYRIDSFFDVFIDITLGPLMKEQHFQAQLIPEPAPLAALAVASLALGLVRRRAARL
ncbi:MAG TPA: hypothetical protein VFA03_17435 [Acetobacteraceae bacterium]|nr:hypothetical protein [Acetobacteraceae bacterium]